MYNFQKLLYNSFLVLLSIIISVLLFSSSIEANDSSKIITKNNIVGIEYSIEYHSPFNDDTEIQFTVYNKTEAPNKKKINQWQKSSSKNNGLIFLLHGGRYVYGSKEDFNAYATYLSNIGFTVISLNYHLIPEELLPNINQSHFIQAFINSLGSLDAVITYVIENSKTLKINNKNNNIIVGGFSAGAITAIHYGYINTKNDLDILLQNPMFHNLIDPEKYILENLINKKYGVDAIINISGSILTEQLIESGDPSIISIHSINDATVPYYSGDTDGSGIITNGSGIIYEKAKSMNVCNTLIKVNGNNHNLFANGVESHDCKNCRSKINSFLNNLNCQKQDKKKKKDKKNSNY